MYKHKTEALLLRFCTINKFKLVMAISVHSHQQEK